MCEGGGVFVFRDGGTYCGEWTTEGAHGCGVCTGPNNSNVFEGRWEKGAQVSGVFSWPSGQRYAGTWANNTRHGLGKEIRPDGSEYCGDFRNNLRGTYGVLKLPNGALYRGTWEAGLQDGVGLETYADKGVYRGQYKKGRRHGYGTRSSAAYEHSYRLPATSQDSPVIKHKLRSITSTDLSTTSSSPPVAKRQSVGIVTTPHITTTMPTDLPTAQIYEGQWEEDKRHGYGVLKIPRQYTYFGEWFDNARTGHGVLVFDDGRKEEGKWEDGHLSVPLKRKKLSIKQYQMESRVKQAHTLAIQAATSARTKAILAESRASTSTTKAQAAAKAVLEAESDARTAQHMKKLYQKDSMQAEHILSPLADIKEGLSCDLFNDHSDSPVSSLLMVPETKMSSRPSFEDLSFSTSRLLHVKGEEKEEDMDEKEEEEENDRESNELASVCDDNSSTLVEGPISIGPDHNGTQSDSLKRKRKQLLAMGEHKLGDGTHSFSATSTISKQRKRVVTDRMFLEIPQSYSLRQRHHVDNTTGEMLGSADITDDEGVGDGTLLHPSVHTTGKERQNSSVDADVLLQMANWNKTIAYINFILLFFLLILIVVVVGFLSFYLQNTRFLSPPGFVNTMA